MNNNNEDLENDINNNSDKNNTLTLTDLFKHTLTLTSTIVVHNTSLSDGLTKTLYSDNIAWSTDPWNEVYKKKRREKEKKGGNEEEKKRKREERNKRKRDVDRLIEIESVKVIRRKNLREIESVRVKNR